MIRALSGRESIVPNEMLITQRVENLSLADRNVLVTTVVQVAYGTDLETLMPQLVQAVAGVPRVLADPGPGVQLSDFAADGLELTVLFWICRPRERPGQRALGRQPGAAGRADPVAAAVLQVRRLRSRS